MARRRKKRGGRKKKSIPVLPLLPALVPASTTLKAVSEGMNVAAVPEYFVWQSIGYSASDEAWNQSIMTRQLGLAIAGIVGHKIANKTVNKYIPSWVGIKL